MRRYAGAVIAAALACAILLGVAWLAQSSLATMLGIPSQLRSWVPALAGIGVALIVLPLAALVMKERRSRR